MVAMGTSFGMVSRELEYYISEHKDGIRSVLQNQINAAHYPDKLQARYHPFATWEIVSKSDSALNHESGQSCEEVILDLFFHAGFGAGGNYKQLIIRRYGVDEEYPLTREIQQQKYIFLQDGKDPVDALQRALNDLPLD